MKFADAHLLWLLLVLPPALVGFYWWALGVRRKLLTQFIQARLLPGLIYGLSPIRQKIRMGLTILAVVLVILALARPQWGFDLEETKQRGLDIVVAIDTSKSMLAEDVAPKRLARAKLAALDLMKQAKSDRLGLIAFAGSAFLQCPLTIDDTAFRQSVEALDVNTIPQGGTALAEAINIATTAFKEGDNYKVLVMFTDGEDNEEGAVAAAQAAAKEGMLIFTVGFGTAAGEILHVTDSEGKTDYVRDEQGNVVKSHLNEALLQQIAGATSGGFYLPLRGARTIDTLYERGLAPLPKSDQGTRVLKQYHERYHWPLAAAILLLIIEMLIPESKRRRRRSEKMAPVSPIPPSVVAVVILLFSLSGAGASPATALREYQAGKYDSALKDYKDLLERRGTNADPRLHFNAGAAAYRDQQFNEAAQQFSQAVTAPDLQIQQQAYYNLGNTLFRIGESADDKKKQDAWETALKVFEKALKLNQQDTDAKYNYDFVKQKLEELKKQKQDKQDQQNKDNQDQDKKQDQSNQQQSQDQQGNQNKQDQNKQSPKDQKQQDQSGKQNPQPADNKGDQQKKDSGDKPSPDQAPKPDQAKSSEKPEEKSDKEGEQPAADPKSGPRPMTPQEARQLMDAQKGDEHFLQLRPQGKPENPTHPLKDW